jgi:hypothetical protein
MTKLIGRVPDGDLPSAFEAARAVAGDDAVATLAGDAIVEQLAPGVGKHAALAEVAADRGVPHEAIVAFGDHVTDAGMLAWAGLGIAVENAHPEAREAADELTASNDEDGVALALERLLGL